MPNPVVRTSVFLEASESVGNSLASIRGMTLAMLRVKMKNPKLSSMKPELCTDSA